MIHDSAFTGSRLVVNDHGDRDNHENDVPETQVRLQVDQSEK